MTCGILQNGLIFLRDQNLSVGCGHIVKAKERKGIPEIRKFYFTSLTIGFTMYGGNIYRWDPKKNGVAKAHEERFGPRTRQEKVTKVVSPTNRLGECI